MNIVGEEGGTFDLQLALERDEEASPLSVEITDAYSKLIKALRQSNNPKIVSLVLESKRIDKTGFLLCLISTQSQADIASNSLKSIGVVFILKHEMFKSEKLYDVVKFIRHTAVTDLMKSVDTLLASNPKEAVASLKEAKDMSLYNMLKNNYYLKNKTKAVDKIERN